MCNKNGFPIIALFENVMFQYSLHERWLPTSIGAELWTEAAEGPISMWIHVRIRAHRLLYKSSDIIKQIVFRFDRCAKNRKRVESIYSFSINY